ncbi:MAG: AEC family transporter [Clostridia bacterium]|nr:AEC family transporter [Clostridia bacterium]
MVAFLTSLLKVAIMLILIAVGWILSKKEMISDKGSKDITNLLVYIVAPCLTISSFANADTSTVTGRNLVLSLVGAIAAMGLAIAISFLFYGKAADEAKRVIRFSIVFSNCGFMGMPLVQSIIGNQAVVYCTLFIGVFNFLSWTYGYTMMSTGNTSFKDTLKKAILNPGTIGLAAGLAVFFLKLKLPEVIEAPITYFGALNTPLAMVIVGNNISKVRFRDILTDKRVYIVSFIRLVIAPALVLPVLCLLGSEHDVFLTTVLQAAAPVAANSVIFAVMFGRDAKLASKLVAGSTILSLITIPIFTMLSEELIRIFC